MVRLRMEDGKCRARMSAGTIEEDDDILGQAVTKMALTSLKRLVGRQAVIKTGTSRDAVWLAGAYGVVNTVRLYASMGRRLFTPFTSKRAVRFR